MKDRAVQYPNRFKLTPVAGTTDTFDLVPVPGTVTEAGTDLSKANLLSDAVAAVLGLTGDPTVNDAWLKLINTNSLKLGYALPNNDLNSALTDGIYSCGPTAAHLPPVAGYYLLHVMVSAGYTHDNSSNWIWQVAYKTDSDTVYTRRKINSDAWQSWTSNKFTPTDIGAASTAVITSLAQLNDSTLPSGVYNVVNVDLGGGIGGYWTLVVSKYADPNYCSQLAISYQGGQKGYALIRTKDGGAWQPWEMIYTTAHKPTPADIGAARIRSLTRVGTGTVPWSVDFGDLQPKFIIIDQDMVFPWGSSAVVKGYYTLNCTYSGNVMTVQNAKYMSSWDDTAYNAAGTSYKYTYGG